ncbi:MAG: ribonuclease Z [Chitinophagaceae bacterium]|nr:MAG: ribonuclease Z [Chitinophagaceae bacterium]
MSKNDFEVFILGSNSALPVSGKYPTAQLLKIHHDYILLDCGEGTQFRLNDFKLSKSKINHIFISHLHGDHFFGLPGLLTSYRLSGRTKPLHIYSHEGLEMLMQTLINHKEGLTYEVFYHELKEGEEKILLETESYSVESVKMIHRIPCFGFIFREKEHKRKILKEKIEPLNLSPEVFPKLQSGQDVTLEDGKTLLNKDYTFPPEPSRAYAFLGDTRYNEDVIPKIKDVDLLYHETTFAESDEKIAFERYHSTNFQAAEIAKKARVKKLLIGHISTRYKDIESFVNNTKQWFSNTAFAEEGKWFKIG